MTSYRAFDRLRKLLPADGRSGHGVRMRTANFFFDKPIEQNPEEYEKMVEIANTQVCIDYFEVLSTILTPARVDTRF